MTTLLPNLNSSIESTRHHLFLKFCKVLEDSNISYVILSGYESYPNSIGSDVDFMVSEIDFKKLPILFSQPKIFLGANLVQFLRHETTACYFILAKTVGAQIAFLHPDAATNFRRGRLWQLAEDVLPTRRQHPLGFWIPSAAKEFEYYFIKRIDKEVVTSEQWGRLIRLFKEDQQGCMEILKTRLSESLARNVESALKEENIYRLKQMTPKLKAPLLASSQIEPISERFLSYVRDVKRKINRIIQPTGLIIAVLGPDGSGKTTVIEHLQHELAQAFRKVKRYHLRPHFGKEGTRGIVTNPHSFQPRSSIASFAKIMLFVIDYWWGYIRRIYPAKVCSTLVIFDRHFYDIIIDPARYRVPNNFWPAKLFAKLIPKPDIWLVLDAPPALLVSRKGELDILSAETLTNRYHLLAQSLPNAYLVSTGGTINETYCNAITPVLTMMAKRSAKRLGVD